MHISTIDQKILDLGIQLPETVSTAAAYLPYVVSGKHIFISGQLPLVAGVVTCKGQVGGKCSLEKAKAGAQVCMINVLAALKEACHGDFDKVQHCIRLGIFVSSAEEFTDQHLVANGASELLVDVFGEEGKHARAAVGVTSLPLGASVEVEALFYVR